jgi:lysophospholipase L1-like esterase
LDKYPDHYLQIYNRGISGDRILTLENRWENDSLRLLPDLVSILIGINDTWNYLYLGLGSSPDEYRQVYVRILDLTLKKLPDVELVLCEPFVLVTGEVTEEWLDDINLRQGVVRDLADEFAGVFVPFQSALTTAAQTLEPELLLDDGVHPTIKGHQVLADCWLNAVVG